MGSRKKDPAALRTIGLFTGKTVLEEVEGGLREEAPEHRPSGLRELAAEADENAVTWLGLDAWHEGGDVKVAVHRDGHAVLVLVNASKKDVVYGTTTVKLSKTQWAKLRGLCR